MIYAAFQRQKSLAKTRTNIRLFLDDPTKKDGVFDQYLTSILEGTMEVFTSDQVKTVWDDSGPLYILPWWIGDMPSEGESRLGTISMSGVDGMTSTGIIKQNVPNQAHPSTLQASVFQTINVPGYPPLHNKFPVIVEGTADSIPPWQTEAACRCAVLYDPDGNPRGVVGGRSLTIVGPA